MECGKALRLASEVRSKMLLCAVTGADLASRNFLMKYCDIMMARASITTLQQSLYKRCDNPIPPCPRHISYKAPFNPSSLVADQNKFPLFFCQGGLRYEHQYCQVGFKVQISISIAN